MNTELNTGVIKVFELKYPGYKSIRARILVPAQTPLFVNTTHEILLERGRLRPLSVVRSDRSLSQGQRVSLVDARLADGAGVLLRLLNQAKIIFMHLGLTSLAELDKVAFKDSLDTWLKDRVVDANRRPDS